nr:hypothetical protein [Desulfobacterales bacterium]
MKSKAQPIILAHGICRFDVLLNALLDLDKDMYNRFHYFKGIKSYLKAHGFVAFHSNVGWASSVQKRAHDLKSSIMKITHDFTRFEKVNIIAHSMGGLDARHMIVDLGMESRVASLITVGTPHHGTSFADWGIKKADRVVRWASCLGIDITGFRDLTRTSCTAFNRRAEDIELKNSVFYATYAGVQPLERIFFPLRFSYKIIYTLEGPNDGLVSEQSARWRAEFFQRNDRC